MSNRAHPECRMFFRTLLDGDVRDTRRRIVATYALLLAINVAAWSWAVSPFAIIRFC
jgi:hypothetical protein